MKNNVLFTIVFCLTLVASCHQDPQAPSLPYISVETEEAGNTLNFTCDGGSRELTLKTNRSWTVECGAEWLAFDPAFCEVEPGQDKEFKVLVTAFPNEVGNDIDARVRFKTSSVYSDITVVQDENPLEAPDLIYYNGFGKSYEGWTGGSNDDHPQIHQSNCWRYEKGAGISEVEYYYIKEVEARQGTRYDSMGYQDASAENHLYFNKTGALVIGKLKIDPKIKAVDIAFGLLRSVHNDSENIVDLRGEWMLHVSTDGVKWVELKLETESKLENDGWAWCTTGFAFGDTTPEYLWISFDPSVVYRLDDLKITNGKSGNVIDWTKGTEAVTLTDYTKLVYEGNQ